MESIEDLKRALEQYRNGERDLPGYKELAELASAVESEKCL